MASGTGIFTVEFEVKDGKLVGAAKNLDRVGKAQESAAKSGKKHNDVMNGGVASANNAGRSMSKLLETVGGNNGGLVAAYATLATNAFAVSAAFSALRNASQVQQLMQGLVVQGSRTGHTLSLVSDSILQITKNSISAADAMKASSQGFSAGLGAKDIAELTKVATNASIALGRNLPDSMDRVMKGVTKLEPELLDELGLMTKLTEATENYARAQGKSASSLTGLEKRKAFVEAIKKEGELKFGGISDQVDMNRFDQLAAKFQNLTNETIGWIAASKPINGILSLLIDTTYGLAGALTIFGSLIGQKVTNWLHGLAVSAAAAAAALNKQAIAQKSAADAALQASKVKVSTAEAGVVTAAGLSKKMPERYKEMLASREKGTLTAKEEEAGLKALDNSTKKYQGNLDRLTASTDVNTVAVQKKIIAAKEEIAANELRIASEKELAAAQTYAAKRQFSNIARSERASAAQYATTKQARAATSLEAAGGFTTIPKAFTAGIQSIVAYRNELNATKLATLATASAMGKSIPVFALIAPVADTAKVALYGLKLSVQGLGTIFMTILPWVGILTLLASAAELLYDKFFVTEAEKTKKKALEDLGAVLDSTVDHIKEVTRVTGLDIQEGSKYARIAEIKINSLIELADAYIKVSEATKLAADNELKAAAARASLKTTPLAGSMTETEKRLAIPEVAQNRIKEINKKESIATTAGVSFDSKAIDTFSNTLTIGAMGLGSWNEEGIKAIKTADELNQLSPELAKGFFEAAKGAKTQGEKIQLLTNALKLVKAEYSPVRDKLSEFTEALKSAENAQVDFLKSLKPTTPFDNVLTNFQALSNSMGELNKLMSSREGAASKDFTGSFQKIITQIGPGIATALDAGAQSTLTSYNAVGVQINRINRDLEEAKSKKQNTVALENQLKEATEQRATYEKYLGQQIPKQVDAYTDLLASAQQQTILAQSQVTLAQARLSVIQRQGTVTGADVKRQMDAQNAVLAAQQAQEKVKLSFIKLDIDKLNITIQEIEAQQALLEILKKQHIEQDDLAQASLLSLIRQEKSALIAKGEAGSPRAVQLGAQETELIKPKDQRKSEEDLARARKNAEQAQATLKAGAAAVSNSIAASSMQMFTAAEKNTAAAKQDLVVAKEKYELSKATVDADKERLQLERQITEIISDGGNSLKNELLTIKENAAARMDAQRKEYSFRKQSLTLDRDLAINKGLKDQVNYYNKILELEANKNASQQNLIESQSDLEVLNKIAIKDEDDLIAKKQDILTYNQKIFESIQAQVESNRSLYEAQIDLNAKKKGVTDTEATQQLKAIKTAQDTYNLAVSEAEIKKAQIDLEFLLLKGKREQSLLDLQTNKINLAALKEKTNEKLTAAEDALKIAREKANESASKHSGHAATFINGEIVNEAAKSANDDPAVIAATKLRNQLKETVFGFGVQEGYLGELVTEWGKVTEDSLNKVPQALKDALDKGTQTAAIRLEEAMTSGPLVKDSFMTRAANMEERQKVREKSNRSETSIEGVSTTVLEEMSKYIEQVKVGFQELGPQGELVLAIAESAQNIGASFIDSFKSIQEGGSITVAALQIVSAGISAVSAILKATSDAKIANIDKEIAAEEKRDGKSAQSVAKLNELQKKKDDTARKSFNTQKKLMMAQAVVSTAAAIAMALGQLGPIAGPIVAGVIGAMGLAQIAIIAGTQYESAMSPKAVTMPTNLNIGKRGDTVDLAKGPNANAGGEAGYLRGSQGQGSNASNYRTVGSAYGGDLMRGYGNRGFVVGEKGPEVITPDTPISVTPANDIQGAAPINANVSIHALDSHGVQDILVSQKGNIIKMLREAANASGKTFMEDVNVNVYTRPSVGKL